MAGAARTSRINHPLASIEAPGDSVDYSQGSTHKQLLKGKGAMSGRKDLERDLEPDLSSAAFLAGISPGGPDGIHGPKGKENPFSIYVLVRSMRNRWLPSLRWMAVGISRVIPESFLDRLGCELHDGTIWEPGSSRAPGPGDTCAVGYEVRRQRDREIGFRLIESTYPIIVLVGLLATLFSCLRIISYNQQVYAANKRAEATSPPPESHGAVVSISHISRRW